ncbi:MAG: ADP-ribosylglycohydrolase family protein [Lentisphaerae bacterium]|nr:MAG: ADP-ribosylglycohydrolase family protein [Lentisphaerota bacterium]
MRNPYREWIGAQIRGDFFGYAAAGNPLLAAELAWRDARLSHVKNGIYGEMWVAGMLAYAAVAPTPEMLPVIQAGLACIPPESRLSRSIRKMIERYQAGHSWQQVAAAIHQEWDENKRHHWCHTISNAEIVTLALLWGENDAVRTLALAVYPAFDTDCNGATAGSVFGMLHGKNAFPRYLSEPLRDTIYSGVAGYHKVAIGDMVEQTLALIRQRPDL